jgi:peroxiredoxin
VIPERATSTLKARLTTVMASREPWYQALLVEIALHLDATARAAALGAGDPMPDFVLPNAEGELVFSDELLALGPLVVCFFRGDWCPFCKATLEALQETIPAIKAAGATLIAVTPDTAGYALQIKLMLGLSFEVLSDVDNATGLNFGVVYKAPEAYRAALLSYRIDLEQRHGDAAWLLPLPAIFIAGKDGILRYGQASGDVTDRTEPDTILKQLRRMRSEPTAL